MNLWVGKKIINLFTACGFLGVSVDGFKKEFERKSSLTSSTPVKPKISSVPKRTLIDKQKSEEEKTSDGAATPQEIKPKVTTKLSNNGKVCHKRLVCGYNRKLLGRSKRSGRRG